MISGMLSQLTICAIFIALALGYGTVRQKMGLEDLQEMMWPMVAVCLIHGCIILLSLLDHEERHRWHDYQGPHGELLCIVRLCLFALFCASCFKTWQKTQNESTVIIDFSGYRRFLQFLSFLGTIYFLSLPTAVLLANHAIPGPA